MGKKQMLDYDFKVTGFDTFKGNLYIEADNDFVKRNFQRALRATVRKAKMDKPDKKFSELEGKHEAPKYFHNIAKLQARKTFDDIRDQVGKDGIKVGEFDIDKIFFYKSEEKQNWCLLIEFGGLFVDER